MKVTTLIPVHLNDGTPVPAEQLTAYVGLFWSAFGGCTVEGTVEGHWVNAEGTHFADTCIKLFVFVADDQFAKVEQIVRQIGNELAQEAMFLEVDETVSLRIIDTK